MIDSSLDALMLRQIRRDWHTANAYYLSGALRPPSFGLCDTTTALGRWKRATRSIELDRTLVRTAPWEQVVEVLRHEMAHQYAHEVLGASHERPHGSAFAHALERLGVDRVRAGLEAPATAGSSKIARRVRKLMSLAQSDNQHEAEAAMARAQKLMLEHNLACAGTDQQYTARIIGPRKLRFQRWEQLLVGVLSRHFFVDVLWIHVYERSRRRECRAAEYMGTPANLDTVEYVHAFLTRTGADLYAKWAKQRTFKRRSDRGAYLNGVVLGFDAKLKRERERHRETGLVWVGDPGLQAYGDQRYPSRASRGRSRIRTGHAYAAGHQAGSTLTLHQPLSQGPSGARRLLGG